MMPLIRTAGTFPFWPPKEAVIVELRAMLADARRPWLERLIAAIRR